MAIFTIIHYPVNALIEQIDLGNIGLPDLQRPFVWPNINVAKLFDSLYRGYPAGFLVFWDTGADATVLKGIGIKKKQAVPNLAIVDGQQRLTSLYAVMKGVQVLRSNFKRERIRIAFNPLLEKFDVSDAAILKDKYYIPDISVIWQPGVQLISFAQKFIAELGEKHPLKPEEVNKIGASICQLQNLPQYQFVAQTLSSTDTETIAEVFVRINGQGKKLNQSDFIMTLMSVYWDQGRTELETFARQARQPSDGQASPFNHFIKPAPDQMLRVTVGVALKRARLANVYNVLSGRDAQTGIVDPDRRARQFDLMEVAQKHVLNLTNWHHFLGSLTLAGYRGEKMISSQAAIIFSYVLYLIGATEYGIDKTRIRKAIAEFYFMAALTGRYTGSSETRFEADLGLIRDLADGDAFLAKLREMSATTLTSDYWAITLPNQLATSAARSPSRFAYQAALIKLEAKVLYSPLKIADLADPAVKGAKAAFEQHHLFPRGYLEANGITLKQINQIANFAPVEWPDNIKIGKKPPSEYVPPLDHKLTAAQREQMYGWHALPHLWWELPYDDFLVQRCVRMASVIQQAWELLTIGAPPAPELPPIVISDLISGGENGAVEFKSTLRTNLHTGQVDEKIHLSALKTIAAFLNAKGGTLLIGVADNGDVLGLDADGFPNEDKMGLHLVNLVKDRLGDVFLPYVHPHFEEKDERRVLAIRCEKGPKAAFVKDGNLQRFFVRGGCATTELTGASVTDYVKQRFV